MFHGLKNLYVYDQLIKMVFCFRGPYRRTLRTPSVRGIGKATAALRAGIGPGEQVFQTARALHLPFPVQDALVRLA